MLICDLAEVYNIYDYRSFCPSYIATLVAGLRDTSRLVQESCDVHSSQSNLLLAHVVDKLSIILKILTGDKSNIDSMVERLSGRETNNKTCMGFDSADDFKAYWEKINNGG